MQYEKISVLGLKIVHDLIERPPANRRTDCNQATGVKYVHNRPNALLEPGKSRTHPQNWQPQKARNPKQHCENKKSRMQDFFQNLLIGFQFSVFQRLRSIHNKINRVSYFESLLSKENRKTAVTLSGSATHICQHF